MLLVLCVVAAASVDPSDFDVDAARDDVRVGFGVAFGHVQGLGPTLRLQRNTLSLDVTGFTYGALGTWFTNGGVHGRHAFALLPWLDATVGGGVAVFHRYDEGTKTECALDACTTYRGDMAWLHIGVAGGVRATFVDVVQLDLSMPLAATFSTTRGFEGVWPVPLFTMIVSLPL